jgi:hypothetical protein
MPPLHYCFHLAERDGHNGGFATQQGVLSVNIFRPAQTSNRFACQRLRRLSSGPLVGFLSVLLQNRSHQRRGGEAQGARDGQFIFL